MGFDGQSWKLEITTIVELGGNLLGLRCLVLGLIGRRLVTSLDERNGFSVQCDGNGKQCLGRIESFVGP